MARGRILLKRTTEDVVLWLELIYQSVRRDFFIYIYFGEWSSMGKPYLITVITIDPQKDWFRLKLN